MTDKQIIIDGVDVSTCAYHSSTPSSELCYMRANKCNENPNCYFKQLGRLDAQYNAVVEQNKSLQVELNRKTQECEELEKELRFAQEQYNFVRIHREIINAERIGYEHALKKIKEIASRLRTKRDYHSPDEVNDDIDSILQKCEVINSESKET